MGNDNIIIVLNKIRKEIKNKHYQSMCIVCSQILNNEEIKIFNNFYEKSVKNRKVFFYRNGERVHENDIPEYKIDNVYLFEPSDTNRTVKWISSKIIKLQKKIIRYD